MLRTLFQLLPLQAELRTLVLRVWQAGGSQSMRLQPPSLAPGPSSKRAQITLAGLSSVVHGPTLLSPSAAPCPCRRGGWQQCGLESSVHKLCKVVCEQLLGRRSLAGLHKNAPQEVPAVFRDVGGQLRVGRLGGDLENGGHSFILCPRWFLCQHLHHRAAQAPGEREPPRYPTASPKLPAAPHTVL